MEILSRQTKRELFVKQSLQSDNFKIEPLANDASLRQYFRIFVNEEQTLILMDDEGCRCRPHEFLELSEFFAHHDIDAPIVLHHDFNQGLFIISDLGNDTLTRLLINGNEEELYSLASDPLCKIAAITKRPSCCADLNKERLVNDICFFTDWYFPMATGYPLDEDKRQEFVDIINKKVAMAYQVPNRILLWDYHVDNIILPPNKPNCAIIDFQDAMWGPLTYDIMSLLEDARREVSPQTINKIKDKFFASLNGVNRQDFDDSFAFLSMFRHMRVLGRFTILMAQLGKDRYLQHIPHLWNMLNRTLEHHKLKEVKDWLDSNFPRQLRQIPQKKNINKAIILAAGRGSRMQDLTNNLPKPLIEVGGKKLIDYNFDRLKDGNIKDVVVNLCYKGDMIRSHIQNKFSHDFNLQFSEEEQALETGGGVKNALALLKDDVFFVCNSDVLFIDKNLKPAIWKMVDTWDSNKHDIIILLHDTKEIVGDNGNGFGDYKILNGLPERNCDKSLGFPYMFIGISIVHKRIFDNVKADIFSLRELFDIAQEQGRLGAVINKGTAFHVGTPQALEAANAKINQEN